MSSHPYELARRLCSGLTLGAAPARVSWEFDDLATADGHLLHAVFHASLRAIDDPTEQKMLAEVLLTDRDAATTRDVERYYEAALHQAARQAVREKPADHWLVETGRSALCEMLKKSTADISFACGLEVLGPIRLELDSPTLTQQQVQAMHRTLAEQQTAGRVEHFQRAADLLKQFETERGGVSPAVVGRAIESLNPADRGSMLKTLLLAGSSKSQSTELWAVAGTAMIRFSLASESAPTVFDLPPSLGPLRSLQNVTIDDRPTWVLGARDGVITLADPGRSAPVCYRDAGVDSTQGFSRVLFRSGQLIACHGEAGLVTWNLGQSDRPERAIRPADLGGSPRNLVRLGTSMLLFSVGQQLMTLTDDGSVQPLATAGPGNIVAIIPDGSRFILVHEDGTLRALERATRSIITLEHRGRRIATAAGLPWLGGQRLLLAGDDGAIDCVGVEDELLTQYISPHRGARRLIASTSHVAALAGDRTRVIVWQAWDGKSPVREISLLGITPHRVADLQLA